MNTTFMFCYLFLSILVFLLCNKTNVLYLCQLICAAICCNFTKLFVCKYSPDLTSIFVLRIPQELGRDEWPLQKDGISLLDTLFGEETLALKETQQHMTVVRFSPVFENRKWKNISI